MGTPAAPWNDWFHCMGNTYGTWLPGDPRGFRTKHHRHHIEGDYKLPPPPGMYDDWLALSRSLMQRQAVVMPPAARPSVCLAFGDALLFHHVELVELAVSTMHIHLLARFTSVPMPHQSQTPQTSHRSKPRHSRPGDDSSDSRMQTPGSGDPGLCAPGNNEHTDRDSDDLEDDIDWSQRDPRVRYAIGKAKSWSSREAKRMRVVPVAKGGLWAARGKVLPIQNRGHQLAVVKYIRDHARESAAIWSTLRAQREGAPHSPASGDAGL